MSSRWSETDERQCLARAMYFESNRSSDQGMLAVGTVVMNRRDSGRYPRSICGVVGQPRQFAPGALSNSFNGVGRNRALKVADAVLAGKRMPGLDGVYHFHTAGYSFPYTNMHYVMVAGGNAFYQKRSNQIAQNRQPPPIETQFAAADQAIVPRPVVAYRPRPAVPAAPPLPPDDQEAPVAAAPPPLPQERYDEAAPSDLAQTPPAPAEPVLGSVY